MADPYRDLGPTVFTPAPRARWKTRLKHALWCGWFRSLVPSHVEAGTDEGYLLVFLCAGCGIAVRTLWVNNDPELVKLIRQLKLD